MNKATALLVFLILSELFQLKIFAQSQTPCASYIECRNDWLSPGGQFGEKNTFDIYSGCQFHGGRTSDPGITCENNPTEQKQQREEAIRKAAESITSPFSPFAGCSDNAINTAFGCVSVNGTDFVSTLLTFGIGIAGGIAMLLIIFGGFQILTSAGNPERLNAGKELISSAITGLLMIVFSVFLLRIIGVDILGIPSFS